MGGEGNKMKRKGINAKKMFNIWLLSFGLAMLAGGIYVHGFAPEGCLPPVTVPWQYQVVGLLFILLYLYPLLFRIHYKAKNENETKITAASKVLIVFITIFLACYFYLLVTDPVNLLG